MEFWFILNWNSLKLTQFRSNFGSSDGNIVWNSKCIKFCRKWLNFGWTIVWNFGNLYSTLMKSYCRKNGPVIPRLKYLNKFFVVDWKSWFYFLSHFSRFQVMPTWYQHMFLHHPHQSMFPQSQLKSTNIDTTPDHAFRSLRNHFRFVLSQFYRFLNDPIKQSVDCIISHINFHFQSNCLLIFLSPSLRIWRERSKAKMRRDNTLQECV